MEFQETNVVNDLNTIQINHLMNTLPINALQKSIELLKRAHLPITEIALSCGFSSLSYYSSVFNKLKGMSPKDLRNTFKKKLWNL